MTPPVAQDLFTGFIHYVKDMQELKLAKEWIFISVPVQEEERVKVQQGNIAHYIIQCYGLEGEHQSAFPEKLRELWGKASVTIQYRVSFGKKSSQTLPLILKIRVLELMATAFY